MVVVVPIPAETSPYTLPSDQPPVWTQFLDLDNDFRPWLGLTNSKTGVVSEQQLQMALDFASEWVQDFLQRPIAPTQLAEYLDGWTGLDGAYLMLRCYPIVPGSVSVTEYQGISGVHVLTEQTPTNQAAQDSFQVDYRTGRLIRTFPGLVPRPFFPGSRNIVVNYTAGYETVPQAIRIATLEFAKYWYRQTFDPRQTRSNEFGNDVGNSLWPGVPNRVTELLTPYRNFPIA